MRGGARLERIVLMMVSAAILGGAFAGCGGGDSEPAPPPSTTIDSNTPTEIDVAAPPELEPGRLVAAQSACLACHRIGEAGNNGPGPDLTSTGTELTRTQIAKAVAKGPGIMPGYEAMKEKEPQKFGDLVAFLAWLGTDS